MTSPDKAAVASIRQLAEKATVGPWYPGHLCNDDSSCNCRYIFGGDDRMGAIASVHVDDGENDCPPTEEAKANQRYIAAVSPDVVLAFLARIEALEAENAALRKALELASGRLYWASSADPEVASKTGRNLLLAWSCEARDSLSDEPLLEPVAWDCTAPDGGRYILRSEGDQQPVGWLFAMPLVYAPPRTRTLGGPDAG